MSAETIVYLDSSALVKLVVKEPESDALRRYLQDWPQRAASALARVEVVRAVRSQGAEAVAHARTVLNALNLVHLDEALLDEASELDPPVLRSLDAIHLAAARSFGGDLGSLVTYDWRLADAARALGMAVKSPGS